MTEVGKEKGSGGWQFPSFLGQRQAGGRQKASGVVPERYRLV